MKNIILFLVLAGLVVGAYFVFFNKEEVGSLITTTNVPSENSSASTASAEIIADSLPILLGIKDIQLDDSIFSNPSFLNLRDSSVILIKDKANEGRPNPFAPIGSDNVFAPDLTDEAPN